MAEYVVFARGMGNFGQNRATKAEQEGLLRVGLEDKHELVRSVR
jgi:hypothetical protein